MIIYLHQYILVYINYKTTHTDRYIYIYIYTSNIIKYTSQKVELPPKISQRSPGLRGPAPSAAAALGQQRHRGAAAEPGRAEERGAAAEPAAAAATPAGEGGGWINSGYHGHI